MERAEALFALHVGTILALVVFAFFAPLGLLLLVLVFHRFLLVRFDGCVISKLEREARRDPDYDFFTELTFRSSGKRIGKRGSENFDTILIGLVIVLALVAHMRRKK